MAKIRLVGQVKRVNPDWVIVCLNNYIMKNWNPNGWHCDYFAGQAFFDDRINGSLLIVMYYKDEVVGVVYENDPYKIVLFERKYLKDIRRMLHPLPHKEVLIEIVG